MSEIQTEAPAATEAEIAAARSIYATDDVNVDDNALASRCDDGDVWVQAWVLVPEAAIRREAACVGTEVPPAGEVAAIATAAEGGTGLGAGLR